MQKCVSTLLTINDEAEYHNLQGHSSLTLILEVHNMNFDVVSAKTHIPWLGIDPGKLAML